MRNRLEEKKRRGTTEKRRR